MWKHLNNITGKKKHNAVDKNLLSNFPQDNAKSLCNKINSNFSNIVPKLRKKRNGRKTKNHTPDKKKIIANVSNTIIIQTSTPTSVAEIIKEINNKNSTGKDGIFMKHIVESVQNSSIAISKLINSIISTEIWPEDLKTQVLRPIYKKGSKKNLDNYRPIALLSNVNKIVEKFFAKQILNFLNKYNVITNKQFGFRQNRGTIDALKYINEIVAESLNNGNYIKAALVDLQKAFDTIDHTKLINKCQNVGLRGKCGHILESYLHERTACTKVEDSFSGSEIVNYGVPQGSVLGPLLFTIYINDIVHCINNCQISLFADDILLMSVNTNKETMEANLQNDFDNLNKYFYDNDLFISETKTKCLTITSPHRKFKPKDLVIHSEECNTIYGCKNTCVIVQNVSEAKYLGFSIDKFWKHKQINDLIKKL
jgi:hypothetical protein